MKGLRDGRLDGVRIGIPIVSHPNATMICLARADRWNFGFDLFRKHV